MVTPRRILVLCLGNLCRSPLAYASLRRKAVQAGLPLELRSRGFRAAVGYPVPPETLAAAEAIGLDLAGHRPTQVTVEDARWAEEALVMEPGQVGWMQTFDPGLPVTGLYEFLGLPEIPDPYGKPPAVHHQVGSLIEQGLESWLVRRFPKRYPA